MPQNGTRWLIESIHRFRPAIPNSRVLTATKILYRYNACPTCSHMARSDHSSRRSSTVPKSYPPTMHSLSKGPSIRKQKENKRENKRTGTTIHWPGECGKLCGSFGLGRQFCGVTRPFKSRPGTQASGVCRYRQPSECSLSAEATFERPISQVHRLFGWE